MTRSVLAPSQRLPDLGRYRALAPFAMGPLYLAEERASGRRVVVKLLPDAAATFELAVATALRGLDHPNLPRVEDCGVLDEGSSAGIAYIAMQPVPGQDLTSILAERRALDVASAVSLGARLCAALESLHSVGFVHLDVKPTNILVGADAVTLVDFGLARPIGVGPAPKLGTPEYWSPELAAGLAEIGPPSDLYSLAIVLFESLSGALPFSSHTYSEVIGDHLHSAPPRLIAARGFAPVTRRVSAAIEQCLAKSPAKRFASASALAAALSPVEERKP